MPERELISEIRAVDWHRLKSTYGSGEVVRDIVLGLASRDEVDVRRAHGRSKIILKGRSRFAAQVLRSDHERACRAGNMTKLR